MAQKLEEWLDTEVEAMQKYSVGKLSIQAHCSSMLKLNVPSS